MILALRLILIALMFTALPGLVPVEAAPETVLDQYVDREDPAYSWERIRTVSGPGVNAHILEMTSQTWRSADEVNRVTWKHWVVITVPEKVRSRTGILFISGGSNDGNPPDGPSRQMIEVARATGTVVTELGMVPNQPLIFSDDGNRERYEDAIIAYTWDKFLRTGDDQWPLRLPMTKSAVRAMDTTTRFCASEEGGKIPVETYIVAGGSKRGWTTWTTAAVDERVIAMVPIVIDVLNVVPSMQHHWSAYGFWAPAIQDYVDMKIMDWMGTPEFEGLLEIEDPYSYRERFTQPKMMLNASGDQFFLPDSSQFYFDDLPGEKYLRYVPNGDHGLDETDALESFVAFSHAILYREERPRFSWKRAADGEIEVIAESRPEQVRIWSATNPESRDFRVDTIGRIWTSRDLEPADDGRTYRGNVPRPENGWTAYFVELTFPSKGPVPFKFTTEVRVKPDKLPFTYRPPENPPTASNQPAPRPDSR